MARPEENPHRPGKALDVVVKPGGAPGEDGAPGAPEGGAPSRTGWRRPELRRRLALLVLVGGAAGLVAYWSRGRSVEVEVIYDFGRHAKRVVRVELSYDREGKGAQPVELDFPSGAPKRWRHTLELTPGSYTVRAGVHLRAGATEEAEVKRYTRRLTVKSGEEQRIVLRLAR